MVCSWVTYDEFVHMVRGEGEDFVESNPMSRDARGKKLKQSSFGRQSLGLLDKNLEVRLSGGISTQFASVRAKMRRFARLMKDALTPPSKNSEISGRQKGEFYFRKVILAHLALALKKF